MSGGQTASSVALRLWGILVLACWLGGIPAAAEDNQSRTWRILDELSEEELARFDFSTDTPRHADIPYMPAEAYPFKPPYTPEEAAAVASRAMAEFLAADAAITAVRLVFFAQQDADLFLTHHRFLAA